MGEENISNNLNTIGFDLFRDVGDFHHKFKLPTYGETPPATLLPDVFMFRLKFMREELDEFLYCHLTNDLAGCADALVDLIYVALGTAHFMGIPFNDIWLAVQDANMRKVLAESAADPRSKRQHRFDVVKPEGWTPPDHIPALGRAQRAWIDRCTRAMQQSAAKPTPLVDG